MGEGMSQGGPQSEMQQLRETLAETQQKALENHPELEEKGADLETLVLDKMEAAGYQPRRDLETLESAEEDLRDPDMSAEERQEVVRSEEVRQAQTNLQEAQQAVAGDQEIQQAQQALREDLMSAMREVNPDIDNVIERMQSLQQQMQQQMQQQGGGEQSGGGMMR
jgi:hypothetical protein